MTQVTALIWDSFRESIDRKLFWVMCAMTIVVAGAMACISFDETGIDLCFGVWHFDVEEWSTSNPQLPNLVAMIVIDFIADLYLGLFGVVVALITTAGVFPRLMTSGTIDVLLSKPISRSKLFVGKYIGALAFVFLQALLFVCLTFLVIGVRWHAWLWGYFWTIPLLVIMFSYLFAFTALFGVMTRSALTALLLTGVAWVVILGPPTAAEILTSQREIAEKRPSPNADQIASLKKWENIFSAVRWVVPKTSDIPVIAGECVDAAMFSDVFMQPDDSDDPQAEEMYDAAHGAEVRAKSINAWSSIGSSLGSECVIILLAMYFFSRRDY